MMKLSTIYRGLTNTVPDPFSADPTGLPEAARTETVELGDGDTFRLTATPVRKRLGSTIVRMLAYNGSIPGPTLRVKQGSEVTIEFTNETEVETTVHWHGLRLENANDGVPHSHHGGVQAAVPTGGTHSYRLRFPDPGVYWYHPHVREEYTQELGLYGNIVVEPADSEYWAPVNRAETLVLDDILMKGKKVAPFSRTTSNRTAMGRYGDLMLVNGNAGYATEAKRGEAVRFYVTNTANVRPFAFRIPGARMKLVGGDGGRVERERLVDEVLLTPSERAVVDVLFVHAGRYELEHRNPERTYTLGTVTVRDEPVERSYAAEFATLRTAPELAAERSRLAVDLARDADKTLALVAVMPGMKHGGHGAHAVEEIEWEDNMALHNRMTTPANMHWKLVDRQSGAENHAIDWSFKLGDRVKLRIENDPHSDHPMQHPFHVHGERFLVLSRDGVPNDNLVWKDTVLIKTGEVVELLMEMTNPGRWMAHCHIAEHLEGGMMLSYEVTE
jgi:FtsP/CotA-like multicopper oxidase with cupredoxin domain